MAKPQTWTVEIEARCPCCGEDVVFNATGCAGVQTEDGVSFTSATPEDDLPSKRELELEARARVAEEEVRALSLGTPALEFLRIARAADEACMEMARQRDDALAEVARMHAAIRLPAPDVDEFARNLREKLTCDFCGEERLQGYCSGHCDNDE